MLRPYETDSATNPARLFIRFPPISASLHPLPPCNGGVGTSNQDFMCIYRRDDAEVQNVRVVRQMSGGCEALGGNVAIAPEKPTEFFVL